MFFGGKYVSHDKWRSLELIKRRNVNTNVTVDVIQVWDLEKDDWMIVVRCVRLRAALRRAIVVSRQSIARPIRARSFKKLSRYFDPDWSALRRASLCKTRLLFLSKLLLPHYNHVTCAARCGLLILNNVYYFMTEVLILQSCVVCKKTDLRMRKNARLSNDFVYFLVFWVIEADFILLIVPIKVWMRYTMTWFFG